MALIEVKRYYSRWDLDNHVGKVILFDADNNFLDERDYSNPDEFQVIVDMLRYEKPLWFSPEMKHLRTGAASGGEPVGEQEG